VSRYAAAGMLGMFGSPDVCEAAAHRVEQELLLKPNDESLRMRKAWMLRAAGRQYEKSGMADIAKTRYSSARNEIAELHLPDAERLRAGLTKDLADVELQSGRLLEAQECYEEAVSRFRALKNKREEIECSLGLIEIAFKQSGANAHESIHKLDDVIAQVQIKTEDSDRSQQDFSRTEAKAYFLKSKIIASVDHELAVSYSIKSLLGFGVTANRAAEIEVLNHLTPDFPYSLYKTMLLT
jgi:tetratricopeptide (TPR) repeat protein